MYSLRARSKRLLEKKRMPFPSHCRKRSELSAITCMKSSLGKLMTWMETPKTNTLEKTSRWESLTREVTVWVIYLCHPKVRLRVFIILSKAKKKHIPNRLPHDGAGFQRSCPRMLTKKSRELCEAISLWKRHKKWSGKSTSSLFLLSHLSIQTNSKHKKSIRSYLKGN